MARIAVRVIGMRITIAGIRLRISGLASRRIQDQNSNSTWLDLLALSLKAAKHITEIAGNQ
ncbi:MAG: hypothetical protein ABFD76_00320 [Smithella sp.]